MASFFERHIYMKLFYIRNEFVAYLRQFDSKVLSNKNEYRPYVGIVLTINNINYFAPLSSPKKKHLTMRSGIDFKKLQNGELGAINLNNMIPVLSSELIKIDIDNITDVSYRRLLQKQAIYINKIEESIKISAFNLYNIINSRDLDLSPTKIKIKNRCCNLPLLEKVYENYKLK